MIDTGNGVAGFLLVLLFSSAWFTYCIVELIWKSICWGNKVIWPVIVEKWNDWQHIQKQAQKQGQIDMAVIQAKRNVDTILFDIEQKRDKIGQQQSISSNN